MALSNDILHPEPRVVPLTSIEDELGNLRQEAMAKEASAAESGSAAGFARLHTNARRLVRQE